MLNDFPAADRIVQRFLLLMRRTCGDDELIVRALRLTGLALRAQRFDQLMPRAVHLARAELLRSIGPTLYRLTLDDLAAAVRIALRPRSAHGLSRGGDRLEFAAPARNENDDGSIELRS